MQRQVHRIAWIVAAPIAGAAMGLGLIVRPPVEWSDDDRRTPPASADDLSTRTSADSTQTSARKQESR